MCSPDAIDFIYRSVVKYLNGKPVIDVLTGATHILASEDEAVIKLALIRLEHSIDVILSHHLRS